VYIQCKEIAYFICYSLNFLDEAGVP